MTGAAGQIAYSLLYSLANGDVFGKNQVIIYIEQAITRVSLHFFFTPPSGVETDTHSSGYYPYDGQFARSSDGAGRLLFGSAGR